MLDLALVCGHLICVRRVTSESFCKAESRILRLTTIMEWDASGFEPA